MGALGESGVSKGYNAGAKLPGASNTGANRELRRREQGARGYSGRNKSAFDDYSLSSGGLGDDGTYNLAQERAIRDIIGRNGYSHVTLFSFAAFNREWDREQVFSANYG